MGSGPKAPPQEPLPNAQRSIDTTETASAVAKTDLKKKKGLRSATLAGETGGYAEAGGFGGKTVLT